MDFLSKRTDPFAKKKNEAEKPIIKPVEAEDIEEPAEKEEEEEVVVIKKTQPAQQKPKKVVYQAEEDEKRDKYTATMSENLRRRIKIHCATFGGTFSDFIEAACEALLKKTGE